MVGTTGFLGVLAGQLPGVFTSFLFVFHFCFFVLQFSREVLALSGFWFILLLTGLGLLCTIFNWEHFFNSFGCGEHFTWVSLIHAFCIPWFGN